MIGCLRTRVREQPIIAFYFEFETGHTHLHFNKIFNIRFVIKFLITNHGIVDSYLHIVIIDSVRFVRPNKKYLCLW